MSMLDQSEKRRTLQTDIRVRDQSSTLLGFTHSEVGGRFKAVTKEHVVGESAIPHYPALRSGPWSGEDPVAQEPPFGHSIDAMPRPSFSSPSVEAGDDTEREPPPAQPVSSSLSHDGPVAKLHRRF
jgi:hypothetical protein